MMGLVMFGCFACSELSLPDLGATLPSFVLNIVLELGLAHPIGWCKSKWQHLRMPELLCAQLIRKGVSFGGAIAGEPDDEEEDFYCTL